MNFDNIKPRLVCEGECPVAATGQSSLEMSCSFTKQVAQLDLVRSWKETTAYKNDVFLLPKEIDG